MKIKTLTNTVYEGTPYEILRSMKKASASRTKTVRQFAREFVQRCKVLRPSAKIRVSDYTYLIVDAAGHGFLELLSNHEKPSSPDFGSKPMLVATDVSIHASTEGTESAFQN